MRAVKLAGVWLCALLVAGATVATTPDQVIEDIKVVGGASLDADSVEYYLGVSVGDGFDKDVVAEGFKRLWESGLVEDLRIDSEEMAPGKIRLIVTVKERPKVTEFAFEGNKKLSTSTIKEKLDADGIVLRRNVPLRSSEVQKFRQAISEVYAKEGYASAIVDPVIEQAGTNLNRVVFKIDEGGKIKIGGIEFDGNEVFSDSRLRGSLKKTKQKAIWRLFSKKTVWSKESWGEDSENLKKYYMNHGYKDIIVGEPSIDLQAGNPSGKTQKEKKFKMTVNIPVQEGSQYRMGSLSLKGVTVFDPDRLRKAYEIKEGKVYNYSEIEAGNETVRDLYHGRGYIYAYTNQSWVQHTDEKRLGRLEFLGNTRTQDKVIRREFRLFEGEWMDMGTLKRSLFKVNQLGYFKLKEDPLEFKFDDVNKLVNVTVKGEEVGRTDIQFGAGYSELDGMFGQFMFSTRNFLGRGATLGVSASVGKRADQYTLSYSEPYFLDRRMVLGGSIYKQEQDLDQTYLGTGQEYYREGKGGSIVWGVGLFDFGQLTFVYGYDDTWARYTTGRAFDAGSGPVIPHKPPLPGPVKDPVPEAYYYAIYEGVTSSFTPGFTYDSRDDPFDPSSGKSIFGRLRYAGGVLGGDFNYFRPEVGFSWFRPITRRHIFAMNAEAGIIKPFSGNEIPIYDRYRLGGERSLRGFQFLSVLPRTKKGLYFRNAYGIEIGGDRYLQLNLEWQIKLGGPIKFILFTDIGNTWVEQQGWDLSLMRYGSGAELRIFLPIFQAPLRFIYGINLKPFYDEDKNDFTFSIGTTF